MSPAGQTGGGAASRQAELVRVYDGRDVLASYRGKASYYSDRLEGHLTASGTPYRSTEYTAAHRTLGFDTLVRVTRIETGRQVYVRINDRGPFGDRERIIDLSGVAARALDMLRVGVADVQVDVMEWGRSPHRR